GRPLREDDRAEHREAVSGQTCPIAAAGGEPYADAKGNRRLPPSARSRLGRHSLNAILPLARQAWPPAPHQSVEPE
ncbi:hypothetical protein, partial [Phyllobacterium sophorae]|uniref:hypothetical protein n=1 Tax=Phyllobacterium sophorae TaxID=1520277 RepID=UPI001AECE505